MGESVDAPEVVNFRQQSATKSMWTCSCVRRRVLSTTITVVVIRRCCVYSCRTFWCLPTFRLLTRPAIVGRPVSFVASTLRQSTGTSAFCLSSDCLMADQYFKDTSRTTDSIEATGLIASSTSLPGLANKFLSSDTSATAMAKFSLDLRDLEAPLP